MVGNFLDLSDWKKRESSCLGFYFFWFPSLVAQPTSGQRSEAGAPSAGELRDFHEMSSQQLIRDHCTTSPHHQLRLEMLMMLLTPGHGNALTLSWSLESLMRPLSGHQPRPLAFHVCSLVTAPALAQGSALRFMCFRNTLWDQGQSVTYDHSGHQWGKLLLLKAGRERETWSGSFVGVCHQAPVCARV